MKYIYMLLCAFTILVSSNTFAATYCMDNGAAGCSVALNVDSGNSSRACNMANAWDSACDCRYVSCTRYTLASGACPSGWTNYGKTVLGKNCCHDDQASCERDESQRELFFEDPTAVQSTGADDLSEVFANSPDAMTNSHWGVVNQVNRSSSTGRTVATEAKLDACIGHGEVDNIKALATFQQLSTCRGSSYCGDSIKNGYCTTTQANGETICQDRCDCVFGGTCDNY